MADSWFYAKGTTRNGPVTLDALRGLIASGQVLLSDQVWREGMANWAPASTVPELSNPAPAPAAPATGSPTAPAPAAHAHNPMKDLVSNFDKGDLEPLAPRFIDNALAKIKNLLSANMFKKTARYSLLAGEVLFYLAFLLYMIVAFIISFKVPEFIGMWTFLGTAWGAGILCLLLSYAALKIIAATTKLIPSTTAKLSSNTWLNCIAFLALAGVIVLFISPFFTFQQTANHIVAGFVGGWLGIIVLVSTAIVALNPELLNVKIEPGGTAGEEFLGLVSFIVKAAVAILPMLYLVATMLSIALLLTTFIYQIRAWAATEKEYWQEMTFEVFGGATGVLHWVVLYPIVTALTFLLYHLIVDLCRATLRIGTKGDSTHI